MTEMIYRVIPLGEILNREYNQDKLNTAFKKFSCQREADLEDFLQEKAVLYEKTLEKLISFWIPQNWRIKTL